MDWCRAENFDFYERVIRMKNRVFLTIIVAGFLFVGTAVLYAQSNANAKKSVADTKSPTPAVNNNNNNNKTATSSPSAKNPPNTAKDNSKSAKKSNRVDLKTQTKVGKKLDRVEDTPKGKKYHYIYRVQAEPTETEIPRYSVDPQYSVSYTQEGFQEDDSVTLLSDNTEENTDSPIWVYDVAYAGSGERMLTFSTLGSTGFATFSTASSEEECDGCGCDLTDCDDHACSTCNACSVGDCYNGCDGEDCSCDCHETCNPDCNCEPSEDCPGPDGHDCDTCNLLCCQDGCPASCDDPDCSCLCHCDCHTCDTHQKECLEGNSEGNPCGCLLCDPDSSYYDGCSCRCHQCCYKNIPQEDSEGEIILDSNGEIVYNDGCNLLTCGGKPNCSCPCHSKHPKCDLEDEEEPCNGCCRGEADGCYHCHHDEDSGGCGSGGCPTQ
jgi:hypothetical protein